MFWGRQKIFAGIWVVTKTFLPQKKSGAGTAGGVTHYLPSWWFGNTVLTCNTYPHGHASPKHGCHSEISPVSGITGGHHVLGVEHLLRQLRHCHRAVSLASSGCQRGETRHEKVKTGEWNHIDSQLPQICVQLPREPKARRNTRHGDRN